jgi:hypothetical protein
MFGLTFGMVLGFAAGTVAALPSQAELLKEAKITKAEGRTNRAGGGFTQGC